MIPSRREVGAQGEQVAAEHLRRHGYRILECNYRSARGEIDIVAEQGTELVLVEVRSRRSSVAGTPEESVGKRKQAQLRRLAEGYLQSHPEREFHCRLDVVAVELESDGAVRRLDHLVNAVTW